MSRIFQVRTFILMKQTLAEAVDDNGSGWISISEINKFTEDKPAGWRWEIISFTLFASLVIFCLVFPSGWRTGQPGTRQTFSSKLGPIL